MSNITGNKFSWRAFTSLYITISFIIMIISGLILYIAPPGRIAKWTYLPILGLEKDSWQALHTIFTFLFIIASGFHLYFNWKLFMSYLHDKINRSLSLRRELLWSLILTIIIFLLTLQSIPPFSSVIAFGESAKNSWSIESYEPPVPHAEEMTISELAQTIQKDSDKLIRHLKSHGITANDQSIIKELALANNISPQDLFLKMQVGNESANTHIGSGKEYGRKTVSQICEEENIALTSALSNLEKAGIAVNAENNIRQLADEYQKLPIEIVDIIKGDNTKN